MNKTPVAAKKFSPSPYQSAIFDWIRNGRGSAIVKAVAGSGKTTTVIRGLQYFPSDAHVQLVAFNTDVRDEMKIRLQKLEVEIGRSLPQVQVSTFHQLGYSAVRSRFKPRYHKLDERKLHKLMPEACGYNEMLEGVYRTFCCKLVGFAKGEGVGVMVDDEREVWKQLIDHYGIRLDDERGTEDRAIEIARDLLRCSNEAALEPTPTDGRQQMRLTIDFNDMLYLPLLWGLKLWQNDVLIIDEAQDTNPTRRELAVRALRSGGRLMAVGDDRQAIYGFTGASHDAMDQIREQFGCIELPLTVSYRCGKSIVARAQTIVPYIEAFDGSANGEVVRLSCSAAIKLMRPSDAVLCRMTAPLVAFAFELIRHGTGCRVLGRDIGASLVSLIKKRGAETIKDLAAALEKYLEEETEKLLKQGREAAAAAVEDRVNCVFAVMGDLGDKERTIPKLVERIENLFRDDGEGLITLSTIHKAKGKEWDAVAILEPEIMPCKWAKQAWEQLQERNLMYVAWTRAKTLLIDLTNTSLSPDAQLMRPPTPLPLQPQPKPELPDLPSFLDRRPKTGGAQ